MTPPTHAGSGGTPFIATMQVIPVAGHDSMLLNLCGAHGPCFIRNIVLLSNSKGIWASARRG